MKLASTVKLQLVLIFEAQCLLNGIKRLKGRRVVIFSPPIEVSLNGRQAEFNEPFFTHLSHLNLARKTFRNVSLIKIHQAKKNLKNIPEVS